PDGRFWTEPGAIGTLEFRVHRVGSDWIATNDLGHIDHDGFLTLHGRVDDAIIRGGFKLAPDKIADVLREHPAVLEAVVIGLADDRLGQVPVAAVEIVEEANVEQAELCEFVKQRLPAYFAPVAVRTMHKLPRTATMKLDRRAIAALFR
ncbi:MAG: acyl-CoA synthetase, partial [Nitrospira sp. OLB3]